MQRTKATCTSGHRTAAIAWSPLDQNFEGPNADIKETAPAGG